MSAYLCNMAPLCAAFVCAPLAAGPLGAQGAGGAMSDSVRIGLRGQIAPKCSLAGMAGRLNFDAGITGGKQRKAALEFTIDCNTPFIYSVSARDGAMLLEGARGSPAAMLTAMPYLIGLAIPTNDGGTLRAECGGAAPGGAAAARVCEADSGYAVAMNQRGQMVVSLPAAGRPVAGRYTENLEITLSVKQ
jgi:hypothetical protein